MIFATGPLTGTALFNSDRIELVTKSPLTGIFAESSAGGYWAGRFKKCGYDALIITGASATPVYLNITEETNRSYVRYPEQFLRGAQYGARWNLGATYRF